MKCTCEWEKTPTGVVYHPNQDCPYRATELEES